MNKTKDLALIMIFISYGTLVLAGGTIGFILKNSFPSLVSGGVSSALIFLFTFLSMQKRQWALKALFSVIAILFIFFSIRFFQTLQFFPSGIMAIVSAMTLAFAFLKKKSSLLFGMNRTRL